MTDVSENDGRISDARNVLTSILLIGFTLFVGVTCVVALAATLTQARISNLSIDGIQISIWKLDSIREQWASIRNQQRRQSDALVKAETDRLDLNSMAATAVAKTNAAKETLAQDIQTLFHRIKAVEPDLAATLSSDIDVSEKVAQVTASQTALRGKAELGLSSLLDSIDRSFENYRRATENMQTIAVEMNSLIQKIEALQKGLKSSQPSLLAVFEPIKGNKENLDEPTKSRIENVLYELNPSPGIFSSLMNRLVTLQPDVLALSLVILMGILGSSLQILHSFFRVHRVEAVGSYFLRISVGAITALVIFIVAKAGVPVIADTSKLSGDAPINPYFVSFLAIISGLLSERAIVTIQNQGERFFGSGADEPDRWALSDLSAELEKQNLTLKTLADYLGSSERDAEAIVKGQEKAGPQQQRTIAIYLRKNLRDLFTDIPPADASTEPARHDSQNS